MHLLYDLIGGHKQALWHFEAERLCSLEVDDKLELGRLHDREVGGFSALEDVASVDADLMKRVREVGSLAHQAANFRIGPRQVDRGDFVARC